MIDLNTRMSESDPKNNLELVTPPVHIKAGPQRVTAAFVQRLDGPVDDLLMPLENTLADVSIGFGITMLPHVRDFIVQVRQQLSELVQRTAIQVRQRLQKFHRQVYFPFQPGLELRVRSWKTQRYGPSLLEHFEDFARCNGAAVVPGFFGRCAGYAPHQPRESAQRR